MSIICKSAPKGNGLLCPQNKNIQSQIAGFPYLSCVLAYPTRQSRTEEGELLFPGCCQIAFHIYGKITKYAVSSQSCQFAERNNFQSFFVWTSPYCSGKILPALFRQDIASHCSGKILPRIVPARYCPASPPVMLQTPGARVWTYFGGCNCSF